MSGFAVARDRPKRQATRRVSGWARDYLRRAVFVDFGCAIVGVFVAAELRFGSGVTATYIALSLAPPVLWVAAHWMAGVGHSRLGDVATAVLPSAPRPSRCRLDGRSHFGLQITRNGLGATAEIGSASTGIRL
jgi:hypothetical protein